MTTVESIGINMGQHPFGTLSTPCRIEAVLMAKGGVQLNIRKVFLMFVILCVCLLQRDKREHEKTRFDQSGNEVLKKSLIAI